MTTVEYQRSSRDDVAGGVIVRDDDGQVVEIVKAFPDVAADLVAKLRAKYAPAEKPAKR